MLHIEAIVIVTVMTNREEMFLSFTHFDCSCASIANIMLFNKAFVSTDETGLFEFLSLIQFMCCTEYLAAT
jgi:hypothetical protein